MITREEVKAEVVKHDLTNKDFNMEIDLALQADILETAYHMEGEPLNIVTTKNEIHQEVQKLKRIILLEGVGTITPKELYRSGRIQLPPIQIKRVMEKLVKNISPDETKLMGLQGVAIFDEIIEKSQVWLEADEVLPARDRNNTAALVMLALEKKVAWLERFGFKPKDMEVIQENPEAFNIQKMKEVFAKVKEGNRNESS